MNNTAMYSGINVYRRVKSDEIVVYRCFKKLPNDGYAVQSADRIRLPLREKDLLEHEARFWELLVEEAPDLRSGLFPSVEAAIADFDASFDDENGGEPEGAPSGVEGDP